MAREFEILDTKVVYANPWLEVREHRIRRDQEEGIYGIVLREDSVVIIPISPSQRTVLLRQYRFPTGTYSWELPMGGISEGETSDKAAQRELSEETGIQSQELQKVGEFRAVPGLTPQKVFVFLASISEATIAQATKPNNEDDITALKIVSLPDVYRMVEGGEITDGFTLSSLLYLRLHLDAGAKG